MEVKRFGDGLLWQDLLCVPGSCIRGAPIPDTDTVAVAERSTIPLDVRSFGVVSQGVTLTVAAGGQSVTCREPSSPGNAWCRERAIDLSTL
jgi:hypothetical protein